MSRAVHIDDIEYPYIVGNTTITIKTPNKKIYPSFLDVVNIDGAEWTWDTIERAYYKNTTKPAITPRLVKLYLEKVILRKENSNV